MNIYVATDDFYTSVCELFSQHGDVKILPRNPDIYRNLPIDLLIFTGGEDVNPVRYGNFDKTIRFNENRDIWEFSVLQDILKKKLKVKKVMGICRGLQVINVSMGGTLVRDIEKKFGRSHEYIHPLIWNRESPMSILTETNSMHHQAIEDVGSRFTPYILAVEPITKLIEVIQWGSSYFGVQFHPEFFPDSPIRREIANMIASWCMGGLELTGQNPAKKLANELNYLNSTFLSVEERATSFTGTWAEVEENLLTIAEEESLQPDIDEENEEEE